MYLTRLMGYDYQIQFRSGATNQAADALSRLPEEESSLSLVLSVPCLIFMEELCKQLAQHETYQTHLQAIQITPTKFPDFTISNNLILRRGRIWLPPHIPLITTLLIEYHATPTGGHLGIAKTIARLMDNFYWDGLRDVMAKFVSSCLDYQHAKYETKRVAGLLCPLLVSHRSWEDLSLDFITGLPAFQGNTVVLVVVDRFPKGIHMGMLPTSQQLLDYS